MHLRFLCQRRSSRPTPFRRSGSKHGWAQPAVFQEIHSVLRCPNMSQTDALWSFTWARCGVGKTDARSPALNERDPRPKYSWARDTRHLTTEFWDTFLDASKSVPRTHTFSGNRPDSAISLESPVGMPHQSKDSRARGIASGDATFDARTCTI